MHRLCDASSTTLKPHNRPLSYLLHHTWLLRFSCCGQSPLEEKRERGRKRKKEPDSPPYRPRLRHILKFSAPYYSVSHLRLPSLSSPSPTKVPQQQTRRFFSRHPVYPVYSACVRHQCIRGRVNVRPSPHATDRRASYAPTHRSPVCFGFPGVTRAPHFSPVTLTSLSLFLRSSSLPYSPILLRSLFLSSSLVTRYIPMSVKPIAWS